MNSLWQLLVHLNQWHPHVRTRPFCRHTCRGNWCRTNPWAPHFQSHVEWYVLCCWRSLDKFALAVCCSEQQSPHSERRVCARCVSDHVHLQIVCRPVIAPDAVTKPVHSQTSVCGLRNRGCNSKTIFAFYVKWHTCRWLRLAPASPVISISQTPPLIPLTPWIPTVRCMCCVTSCARFSLAPPKANWARYSTTARKRAPFALPSTKWVIRSHRHPWPPTTTPPVASQPIPWNKNGQKRSICVSIGSSAIVCAKVNFTSIGAKTQRIVPITSPNTIRPPITKPSGPQTSTRLPTLCETILSVSPALPGLYVGLGKVRLKVKHHVFTLPFTLPRWNCLPFPLPFSEGITFTLPFSIGRYLYLTFYLSNCLYIYPLPASLTFTFIFYLGNYLLPG